MRYIDVKRYIKCDIEMYKEGRFTLPEMFTLINKDISCETSCIPSKDIRQERQEKLYKYACQEVLKAIEKQAAKQAGKKA